MSIPTLSVDLCAKPARRWQLTAQQQQQARHLIGSHVDELGGVDAHRDLVEWYASENVPDDYRREMHAIAHQCGIKPIEVITGNLYYDFIKYMWGCTAFACDTPDGPIHARNMDWHSPDNCLASYSVIAEFAGQYSFKSVSWPGYVGVLSGLAPGRFAITLNAILSDDQQEPGASISLLIRQVCEEEAAFDDAVQRLAETPISSDCLLLVTGPEPGQMVVIERTPSRHALRTSQNGFLVVANDYHILPPVAGRPDSILATTSCTRYSTAFDALALRTPQTAEECLRILSMEGVRMNITVQRMVMSAATGALKLWTR